MTQIGYHKNQSKAKFLVKILKKNLKKIQLALIITLDLTTNVKIFLRSHSSKNLHSFSSEDLLKILERKYFVRNKSWKSFKNLHEFSLKDFMKFVILLEIY